MSNEEDAVRRVVEAFEASDWSEIDVRFGSLRVQLSASPNVARSTTPSNPEPVVPTGTPLTDDRTPVSPPTAASSGAHIPAGAHLVVSPSPGIFWVAPEPGAPPFTDVGQRVDESSTIGIVEVMKLMNHVKAGVTGQVAAVLVGNGVAVDKGEALVAVIPQTNGTRT